MNDLIVTYEVEGDIYEFFQGGISLGRFEFAGECLVGCDYMLAKYVDQIDHDRELNVAFIDDDTAEVVYGSAFNWESLDSGAVND